MKIGIIGAGSVGQTVAARLIETGHDVRLGMRSLAEAEMTKPRSYTRTIAEWQAATGGKISTFADAAKHGEVIFNATGGEVTLAALAMAGADNLAGKVLIDVSNPLDFSRGFPPSLLPAYNQGTSLGEAVQQAYPAARVVKAFNTIAASTIANAAAVPGDHDLFIAGNDAGAKHLVSSIAREDFGWKSIVDLGDISGARAMEHVLPLWLRLMQTTGTPAVNIKVVHA